MGAAHDAPRGPGSWCAGLKSALGIVELMRAVLSGMACPGAGVCFSWMSIWLLAFTAASLPHELAALLQDAVSAWK